MKLTVSDSPIRSPNAPSFVALFGEVHLYFWSLEEEGGVETAGSSTEHRTQGWPLC